MARVKSRPASQSSQPSPVHSQPSTVPGGGKEGKEEEEEVLLKPDETRTGISIHTLLYTVHILYIQNILYGYLKQPAARP